MLLARADGDRVMRFLLHCISPVLARSVALNPFCQGLLIEGEADINAAAR
jgi:hypothetical protein